MTAIPGHRSQGRGHGPLASALQLVAGHDADWTQCFRGAALGQRGRDNHPLQRDRRRRHLDGDDSRLVAHGDLGVDAPIAQTLDPQGIASPGHSRQVEASVTMGHRARAGPDHRDKGSRERFTRLGVAHDPLDLALVLRLLGICRSPEQDESDKHRRL